MQAPPPLPNAREPGWWDRNWKWFVPVLCVFSALALVGIMISVFAVMRSADVYKQAVARAKAAPSVREALGEPITEGLFLAGKINANASSGSANLVIPISGPKSGGTLHVIAKKTGGEWRFEQLVVRVGDTDRWIDLRGKSAGPPAAAPR